ncbi:MAG: adenylate kinase [Actinomycetota bacterium]|nr:adenylate kinase [Actinomycetota bacterium]
MSARVIVVVLGKQGAGKGTQCKRLAQHLGVPHVSTGDILRAAVRDRTTIGLEVASILEAGQLVNDDLVNRLVEERFNDADTAGGALLDGFPRTEAQAEALDQILGDDGVKICINLDVPNALVAERLSSRRVCQECGAIYRDSDIEAISGTCTNCGGDVVQRADDMPEAIHQRLEVYERDTAPLLAFYEARGLLVRIDGDQAPQTVTAEILDALAERGVA